MSEPNAYQPQALANLRERTESLSKSRYAELHLRGGQLRRYGANLRGFAIFAALGGGAMLAVGYNTDNPIQAAQIQTGGWSALEWAAGMFLTGVIFGGLSAALLALADIATNTELAAEELRIRRPS